MEGQPQQDTPMEQPRQGQQEASQAVYGQGQQEQEQEQEQQQEQQQRERKVMLGELPPDFLRLVEWRPAGQQPPQQGHMQPPMQQAPMSQQAPAADQNLRQGFLHISLVKAKLAKNYGMMTMDPYVIFTIGPYRRRSRVAAKGGIEPRWNDLIRLPVLPGYTTLHMEVFDFRSLTGDKRIAWGDIDIYSIDEAQPREKLYHLSGKQGEDKEGVISLHIRFEQTVGPPVVTPPRVVSTTTYGAPPDPMMGLYGPPPPPPHVHHTPMAQPHPPSYLPSASSAARSAQEGPPPVSQDQVQQLQDMFPQLDKDVLEDVLRSTGGNLDAAISQLLQMNA